MIEIQYYSGTALLLLVNLHTASKQWHRVPQLYQLSSEKEDALLPATFNPLYSSMNQLIAHIK